MKYIVILAVLCSFAMASKGPARWVMPRLPLKLLLSGKFHAYDANERIVGGSEVQPNSLPFQLSLQRRSGSSWYQSCGASILSENKVLCAAHCTTGGGLNNMRIVAGEHNIDVVSGLEQESAVTSVSNHPDYNSNTLVNDISIIWLSTPLTLGSGSAVQAISLPAQDEETNPGTPVTVSGWGTLTSGASNTSPILMSVDLDILSDAECQRMYPTEVITDGMICAARDGKDSCQGDSGGPLFSGTGGNAVQLGIVSWGYGCADPLYPGVYTQVSKYIDWINAQTEI